MIRVVLWFCGCLFYDLVDDFMLIEKYDSYINVTGLRILTGKKHPKIKFQHIHKKYEYGHLGRSYIKLTLSKRF